MTNKINSLGQDQNNDLVEESKAANGEGGEQSDFLISTGSGDDLQEGRKYKVVASALDFQRIVQEYITLARSFHNLAADVGIKLMELIQVFNSLVCEEILGGAAF